MGQGWRRVSEAVLQRTGSIANKYFKATGNSRNEAMFKEASNFARSIVLLEKDLKNMMKSTESHFRNLRGILISPVPRIYDCEEGTDVAKPLEEEPRMLGANMDVEAIPKAAEDAKRRIQTEVMEPLLEWLGAYRVISDRMQSLESLRLELDSRRRTVTNLQVKLGKLRSEQGNRDRAKLSAEIKETEDIMARKEDKMSRCWGQFCELERTVYNSLYTLVRDTAVLRDYTHAALTIVQECFQAAAQSYSQAPNPQFSTNNAIGYTNAYDASTPGERLTPRNVIGGLMDKLRGKSKVPESPVMRDASDQHDQVPYMPPAGYPIQGRVTGNLPATYTQRRTHDVDVPPHGGYVQPAMPTSNGYMGAPSPHRYTQMPHPQQIAAGPTGWTQEGY